MTTVRISSKEYPTLADPTGELNEMVWASLGHMRGTLGHNVSEANSTDSGSAVRWPQVSPIDIQRPKDLKLNEWYWPSLYQHPSEVWIAIAGGDSVLEDVSKATTIIVWSQQAIVAGAWKLNLLENDFSNPETSSSLLKEIVVLCATDKRIYVKDRIYNPYDSNAYNSGEIGFDNSGIIGYWPTNNHLPAITPDSLSDSDIVPCPRCAYDQEPMAGVWHDSVVMGLEKWPVCPPFNRWPSGSQDSQYGWMRSHSASADNDITNKGVHVAPSFSLPTAGYLTDAKNKIAQNKLAFSQQISRVNYIRRVDKWAIGDVATVGMVDHKATAFTAFFENINASGQDTVPNLASRLESWRKRINDFRLAASYRPGRTVFVDAKENIWDGKSMPPSAWIISLARGGGFADKAAGDFRFSEGWIVKELPWPADCLPHDFPVTWSEDFSQVGWVDSAKIGQTLRLYAKSDGSWWTLGSMAEAAKTRSRIFFVDNDDYYELGGWTTTFQLRCDKFPDDVPVFCHRQATPGEIADENAADYINDCDWMTEEEFAVFTYQYQFCYQKVWTHFWWSQHSVCYPYYGGIDHEPDTTCGWWWWPSNWHWWGGQPETYCTELQIYDLYPCTATVIRTAANIKQGYAMRCFEFLQGTRRAIIDYDTFPAFPDGYDKPDWPAVSE